MGCKYACIQNRPAQVGTEWKGWWKNFGVLYNFNMMYLRYCIFRCVGPSVLCFIHHNPNMIPHHVDGLMQEGLNSIANALELRLSCIYPSMWTLKQKGFYMDKRLSSAGIEGCHTGTHYCIHRLHSCHCDSSFMALDLYFKWMLNYNSSKVQQAYKAFYSSTQWFLMVQGTDSIKRCHLTSIGNTIVEIRRCYDHLISTMGFPILVRLHLYIESGPKLPWDKSCLSMTIPWHLPTIGM